VRLLTLRTNVWVFWRTTAALQATFNERFLAGNLPRRLQHPLFFQTRSFAPI